MKDNTTMKATGIVRRIDDLGRIVIPKEIRRVLRIKDGDPLEIYTDRDGEVVFKKYSPIGELSPFANELVESVSRVSGHTLAVCDRDGVIAAAGPLKRDITGKSISGELAELLENRSVYSKKPDSEPIHPFSDAESLEPLAIAPINVLGDISGCVLLFSDKSETCGESELLLVQSIASFLGKQIEV